MNKRHFVLAYRFFFVFLVVIAVAAQLAHSLVRVDGFSTVNFFSFFTIESNLFGAVTFLMSAYMLYKHKKDPQLESLRGAATLYMVITGIVYSLLLTGVEVQNSLAWSNAIVHYIFPIAILFDWLYVRSVRTFTTKDSLIWLIYPLLYAIYTVVRGPFAHHWYPYPFINVAQHGYLQVALNCIVIALGTLLLALLIARLPRLANPRRSRKS